MFKFLLFLDVKDLRGQEEKVTSFFFFLAFASLGNMKRRRRERRQACAGVRRADKRRRAKFIPLLAPSQGGRLKWGETINLKPVIGAELW